MTPSEHHADATGALLTLLRITRVLERIDAGVSPQQYRMLKLIGAGGERSARLAEKLAVARPTLTATADSLVAAGLACREAEPGDRRVVRLCLTGAGQAAVERADAAYSDWFSALLEHTGRGREIIADLLLLDEAMTERHRTRLAAEEARAAARQAGQASTHARLVVDASAGAQRAAAAQPVARLSAGQQSGGEPGAGGRPPC